METITRTKFDRFCAHIARLNGVGSAEKSFSIAPSIGQEMQKLIKKKSDFLNQITQKQKKQLVGKVITLSQGNPVAGRTDTNIAARASKKDHVMTDVQYLLSHTDFDTHIGYDDIDEWAEFDNFQAMIMDLIVEQIAQDQMMIGWNGTHVAATTDLTANPLLQDVNKGWIKFLLDNKPGNHFTGVKVGKAAGSDFKNIDALAMDLKENILDPRHQTAGDLVAIVGTSLMSEKYLGYVNDVTTPSEVNSLDVILSNRKVGGLPAVSVPHFPADGVMVTSFKNLGLYTQKGSDRRRIEDQPARNRIVDFRSSNQGYVIEDLGKAAFSGGHLSHDGSSWS